ncbi:uncharacterized protein LOC127718696 [Mytilus californianus]|uniref:uncharacterized protein LOC127718696 n=1 Tax=Mytilus californianus TaxID=6549 RepID=UPI002245A4DC|nr:uncharacterized protein LOC127718696 [Mytilus californianus]
MERTGKMKDIWLADGSVRNCEEVWINVTTPYISGSVLALILDIPFADLVIGNYVNTSVPKDVCTEKVENDGKNIDQDTCQAVQTRAKKKQEDEKEEKIQVSIDKLNEHVTDNILPQVGKMYSRDELKLAQADDKSLNKVRSLVQENPGQQSSYFIMKSGILYRVYVTPSEEEIYQVVLPQKYRAIVLELAHDIPLSGHLGIKKTRDRILHHYFWPGMFEDVAMYCKSCHVCQLRSTKGKSAKVPLVSIPSIDVPFRRIAIDFVGPLPVTERKNRYILVIVDCSTRYPEAVALRSQDAETVVDSLMEVFSRVGFPEELLSDQGSNFKSSLMLEVCRLLTVEKKVSSVYHPQTNGMCEKFNGVLKRMLKAYASLEPKTWDKYLVYVLFAYREVPNDTTGFSPFELLYGRNVRGPLSVLKEQWEEPEDCQSSVLSYLIETRERLKMLSELAHQNEMNAKQVQKRYYDKKARSREIEVGTTVLVLLPTSESKLLAQWKGPYVVTDKVGPVDYKVKVRGKEKVYHVNMLKTWYERPEALKNEVEFLACIDVAEDKFEDEYIDVDYKVTHRLVGKETVNDVRISEDLTDEQHSASFVSLMRKVLKDCDGFADSFIDDIGIYSDTFEDHLKHIRLVLLALRKANVAARPKKCCFGFSKLEFLGHIVGGGEIQPTQDKIQAIVDFKPPMTKKQALDVYLNKSLKMADIRFFI